jgi:hypothetical protein
MLKKIIIASALVLGFAGSFQLGQTSSGQDQTITMKVGLVPEASACPCDWNDFECVRLYPSCDGRM